MIRFVLIAALLALIPVVPAPASLASAEPGLDAASRAALARLPFDTAVVGSLHLATALRSPVGKRILAALERNQDYRRISGELASQVGLDVQRDVEQIWFAMPPAVYDGSDQVAFIARLTVDQDRFLTWLRAKSRGQLVERKVGRAVYYLVDDAAWAFLGKEHLLLAPGVHAEAVLRAASGGRHSAAANRPLVTAASAAGREGAQLWLAALVPEPVRTGLRDDPLTARLGDVQWAAARLTLGGPTEWRAQLKTSRGENARALVAVLEQMVSVAADSGRASRTGLADALRKTRFTAEGSAVLVEGSLSGEGAGAAIDAVLAP